MNHGENTLFFGQTMSYLDHNISLLKKYFWDELALKYLFLLDFFLQKLIKNFVMVVLSLNTSFITGDLPGIWTNGEN